MARVKRLWPVFAILVLALIVFALFQTGTWPFGGSATTADTTATARQATNATAGASTTTTAGTTGTTVPNEAQQYLTAMNEWYATYCEKADTNALVFEKPLAPTAKEIKRAKDFASAMHASLAAVKGITAPDEVEQAHAVFCAALTGELRELDRLIRAIQSKNKRDIELAFRYTLEARQLELAAMSVLGPYLGKAEAAGSTTPTSAGESAVMTFSDSKHGVTFQYPRAWTQFTPKDFQDAFAADEPVIVIGDPSGGKFGTTPANFVLCAIDPYDAKTDGSSGSALEAMLKKMKGTDPGPYETLAALREFKLNGLDAADTTISIIFQGQTMLFRFVYLHSDRVAIVFEFSAEEKLSSSESMVFDFVLNSLKVAPTT